MSILISLASLHVRLLLLTIFLVFHALAEQSFAFAGSGFLLPYYAGIATKFIENSVIVSGKTRLGGLSGGAITGTLIHSGFDVEKIHQLGIDYVARCVKLNYTSPCWQMIHQVVTNGLDEDLPMDIVDRTFGKGIFQIIVSRLDSRRDILDSSAQVWTRVRNRREYLDLMGATTYLSCYAGDKPYIVLEKDALMDGAYSAIFNDLCPTEDCVKIASYYVGPYTKESEEGGWDCVPMLGPLGEEMIRSWAAQHGKSQWIHPTAPLESTSLDKRQDVPFKPVGRLPKSCDDPNAQSGFVRPGIPDIYPGKWPENPIPFSCGQWQYLSMTPTLESLPMIYELGRKDAELWLRDVSKSH